MILRPFLASDIPAARLLWEGTEGVGLSAADEPAALYSFLQRNPGLSQAAEEAGRLVGTILVGHDGRRGLIHHLAVDPACRRAGLGRALVAAGLAALKAEGIGKCHLMVFTDNAAGRAFWAGIGAEWRSNLELYSLTP